MASQRTRAGWLWLAAYGSVAAASLWLRSAVPVFAIGEAGHDDFLFVRLAYYLGSGSWLGPYNNLTLAKGVGYPAFILAAFGAGVPLKIAEQLLYLGACGFSAWLVRRLSGRRWLPFVLFAVLAFSPLMWTAELARVVREGRAPDDVLEIPLPDGDPVHLPAVLAAAFGLSTSEARRLIGDGAVKADGEVVREFDLARPRLENALVQAGKRRFVRLTPS